MFELQFVNYSNFTKKQHEFLIRHSILNNNVSNVSNFDSENSLVKFRNVIFCCIYGTKVHEITIMFMINKISFESKLAEIYLVAFSELIFDEMLVRAYDSLLACLLNYLDVNKVKLFLDKSVNEQLLINEFSKDILEIQTYGNFSILKINLIQLSNHTNLFEFQLPFYFTDFAKDKNKIDMIISDCDSAFSQPVTKRDVYESLLSKLVSFGNVLYVYNKEIIGYVAYYANDEIKKIAFITLLAVRPEYQRNSIGYSLIDQVENHCHDLGMNYIELEVNKSNKKALSFYLKNGYKYTEVKITDKYRLRKKI